MGERKLVKMPWEDDTNIIYPADCESQTLLNRWDLVKLQLNTPIKNVHHLIEVIRSYNVEFSDDGNQLPSPMKLCVLRDVIDGMTAEQQEAFFGEGGVLQSIQSLVLKMPDTCPGVPWLVSGRENTVKLHQMQVACILATAFFCVFPRRGRQQPSINFNALYEGGKKNAQSKYREKLKCLIHYFWRIHEKQPTGFVTYHRRYIAEKEYPRWNRTTIPLTQLSTDTEGRIEDQESHLQMDFANRIVGGGVLGSGCVQEEIRFVICPELIAARLFCEAMADNEAIIIIGAERYGNYTGYADDFHFAGNHDDTTPFDSKVRRSTQVLVVDALYFRHPQDQYRERCILRELKKIYTGLKPIPGESGELPLATGNWGCGAFRGDPQLKSLLQIMAASQASRKVAYFTFGDLELKEGLELVHSRLCAKSVNVGQLYKTLVKYQKDRRKGQTVFQFVLHSLKERRPPREFFTFLNDEEMAIMEGGQKRSNPHLSASTTKQPRTDDLGERSVSPRAWVEQERSGTAAELSRHFSTSLGNIDSGQSQDYSQNGISMPDMFQDDSLRSKFIPCSPKTDDSDDFIPCTPGADARIAFKKTCDLGSEYDGARSLLDQIWGEQPGVQEDTTKIINRSQDEASRSSREKPTLSLIDEIWSDEQEVNKNDGVKSFVRSQGETSVSSGEKPSTSLLNQHCGDERDSEVIEESTSNLDEQSREESSRFRVSENASIIDQIWYDKPCSRSYVNVNNSRCENVEPDELRHGREPFSPVELDKKKTSNFTRAGSNKTESSICDSSTSRLNENASKVEAESYAKSQETVRVPMDLGESSVCERQSLGDFKKILDSERRSRHEGVKPKGSSGKVSDVKGKVRDSDLRQELNSPIRKKFSQTRIDNFFTNK